MNGCTTEIVRDIDTNNFVVKFYVDGIYQRGADFHCDTQSEAFQHAAHFETHGIFVEYL